MVTEQAQSANEDCETVESSRTRDCFDNRGYKSDKWTERKKS